MALWPAALVFTTSVGFEGRASASSETSDGAKPRLPRSISRRRAPRDCLGERRGFDANDKCRKSDFNSPDRITLPFGIALRCLRMSVEFLLSLDQPCSRRFAEFFEERDRSGTAFDGTRFDAIRAIADSMRVTVEDS